MVGKCKQVCVLIARLDSIRHLLVSTKRVTRFTQEYLALVSVIILASTKRTTGFTHEYLPLVSYYSRVQKCMTGITCKHSSCQ